MPINQALIAELRQEATNTRKLLERIPIDKSDWKPHEKSMSLGRLAMHIAELPGWTSMTMLTDELDFAKFDYKQRTAGSLEELLDKHDEHIAQAVAVLENSIDEHFEKMWTMRKGAYVYFTLPKASVLRSFAFNHLYHHRGQLSGYLRMLDVPIPGMYGPSADDIEEMASANAQK